MDRKSTRRTLSRMLVFFAGWCLICLVSAGCATIDSAVSGEKADYNGKFAFGEFVAALPGDPEVISVVTQKAFDSLGIVKESARASKLDAEIVGHTAKDSKVRVSVRHKDMAHSTVSILIGVYGVGDRPLSERLMNEIKKELKERLALERMLRAS